MAVSRINEAGLNVNQYGNRNVIINGAMQVAQRGTSSTGLGASGGYFVLDRYNFIPGNSAGRLTMTQDSDAPDGFGSSLKLACTTADTSIAAGEYAILAQYLEGQDVQRFKKGTSAAEEITVSFYVKGNATATYTVELEDNGNGRYNSQEFAVTTGWTRVIKTFAADTTGALTNDNANRLRLNFWIHAGSSYTGGDHTDNVWHTTANKRVGDNATSFYDSTSRTLQITGLQMEVGDTATDFEHRTFGDELQRCQRYCQVLDPGVAYAQYNFVGFCESSTKVKATYSFPTIMRAAPTQTRSGNFLYDGATSNPTISSLYGSSITNYCCRSEETVSSGNTGEGVILINNNDATAKITFDAEL